MMTGSRGLLAGMVALTLTAGHPVLAIEIVEAQASRPTSSLPPVQAQVAAIAAPASSFRVSAWVDRADNTYAEGDDLQLWLQSNEDAYLTVVNVPAKGEAHVIFPNAHQPDNFVRANNTLVVPGSDGAFKLRVSGQPGTELIKVIASKNALDLAKSLPTREAGAFRAITVEPTSLAQNLQDALGNASKAWTSYDKIISVVADRPATEAVAATASAFGDEPLRIAADKAVYRIGEPVEVYVASRQDCQLSVISVGSDGQALQLFPNAFQPEGFVVAGSTVVLPGAMGGVRFEARGPAGVETLLARCGASQSRFTGGAGKNFKPLGKANELARTIAVVPVGDGEAQASTSFILVP